MSKQEVEGLLAGTSACSAVVDRRGQRAGLGGGGYDEKGVSYCVLMSSFDVPPLFAVCTPGSPLLASDWPAAAAAGGTGGAGGGGGRGEGG